MIKNIPLEKRAKFYELWLQSVNRILCLKYNLDTYDSMPDQPWRDWFDNDLSPLTAVKRALKNEGY